MSALRQFFAEMRKKNHMERFGLQMMDTERFIRENVTPKQEMRRGRLKLFFGYAPGTGKTFSMLKEARQEKQNGRKVLVGFVDTHGRRETEQLLKGLEKIGEKSPYIRGESQESLIWMWLWLFTRI